MDERLDADTQEVRGKGVDEDWEIASKTKECLIAAVERILEEDKAHLQEMVDFNAKLV